MRRDDHRGCFVNVQVDLLIQVGVSILNPELKREAVAATEIKGATVHRVAADPGVGE